jgi:hypothetical protein
MPNVCLFPDKDSFIDEINPDTNYGTHPGLYVDTIYLGGVKTSKHRTLLTFTIPAEVAVAEVYKGIINLGYGASVNGGVSVTFHRLVQTWTEAGVTWNKRDGTNNWTGPGGAYDSVIKQTTTTPATGGFNWWNVDITGLVTDAITNRSRVLDILIKQDDEAPGVDTQVTAMSKDYTTIPAYRPFLNIIRPPFGLPMEV